MYYLGPNLGLMDGNFLVVADKGFHVLTGVSVRHRRQPATVLHSYIFM